MQRHTQKKSVRQQIQYAVQLESLVVFIAIAAVKQLFDRAPASETAVAKAAQRVEHKPQQKHPLPALKVASFFY